MFFKIWKFNLDKVSTDALTVNLNSAPILFFGRVYTSLRRFAGQKRKYIEAIVGKLYSFFMSSLRS
jgi:hypothetical protein